MSSFDRTQFSIAKNVLFLSNTYPQINNSYEELLWTYWEVCDKVVKRDGQVLYLIDNQKHKLTKAESIDRAWRKLVAEKKIVLTDVQKAAREGQEKEYRKFYGQTKLEVD